MLYKEETYEGRNDAEFFYSPLQKETTMSVNVIARCLLANFDYLCNVVKDRDLR